MNESGAFEARTQPGVTRRLRHLCPSSSSRRMQSTVPSWRGSPRRRPSLAVSSAVLVLALAGCDIPTEVPRWDTRWVIPAERTAFSVADLLPEGVTLAPGGGSFDVPLEGITLSESLAGMCPECAPLDGLTVPKPPFTVTLGGELQLPAEIASATLASGAVAFRLRHDFPFDPIRPPGGSRGFLVLRVMNGSRVLARDSLNGRTTALPPGGVVNRTLQVGAGQISGPIEVEITLHSPAGDPVTIDLSDRILLEVHSAEVRLSRAVVRVNGKEVSTPDIVLELGSVDEAIASRVQEGALQLTIENPFEVTGTFGLRITTPSGRIEKPVEIVPGTSQVRVELSGDELRSMLGNDDVRLALTGAASSPASGAELVPEDEIGLTARLELVVRTARD